MGKKDGKSYLVWVIQIIKKSSEIPYLEWVDLLWKASMKLKRRFADNGMYEVLEFETTLELLDSKGKNAVVKKRQKVRYLQDHIIAYQDQAWGDGEILVDYKCSPGIPVDQYQFGHKTIVLISLRSEKNKDDIDVFNIRWMMKSGFVKNVESWSTVIQHKTKYLKVEIIFPESRPPHRVTLIEGKRRKASVLSVDQKIELADGRWLVSLERYKPKLNGEYILEWEW